MDLDENEIFGGMRYQEEDSGSAYEASSDEQDLSSENAQAVRTTNTNRDERRERSESSESHRSSSEEGLQRDVPTSTEEPKSEVELQIIEEAQKWAASFEPPESHEIRTPPRQKRRKKQVGKPPSEHRFKRLKPYYNNDYRELLNSEIHDARHGEIFPDSLEPSQIGSSTWTAMEKNLFFTSLAKYGIDNVRSIASYIRTKSEPEVQEFIQLLRSKVLDRKKDGRRDFMVADLPAATDISEECCLVLERAGDALAARQEMAEVKVERSKWSNLWLIDEEVSQIIERRRRRGDGKEALDAVLPAGNLFLPKNWLELSRRVFMNPGGSRSEDNWETLAEPNETPAIRATALEDFHSLAVNIAKKLVSTTLFCTMSRLRSGNYHYVKHSEVTADDVEAAAKILGMEINSEQFWLGCAKRNNLDVIDDGADEAQEREALILAYDDVEEGLRNVRRSRSQSRSLSRSRSRSISRHARPKATSQAIKHEESGYSSPSEVDSEDMLDLYSDSSGGEEAEPLAQHESPEFTDPESPTSLATNKTTRIEDRKAAERAQDHYAEAVDMQASQAEEARLWTLIEQEPPFEEIKAELEELERPLVVRDDLEDGRNWREHLEYWQTWETMSTPVPNSAFMRNRERQSRRAKARAKGSWPRSDSRVDKHPASEEDLESADERDESEGHGSDVGDRMSPVEDQLGGKLEGDFDDQSVASVESTAALKPLASGPEDD